MTEAERDLLIAIAEHIIDGWKGSPMANDLEFKLILLKDEMARDAEIDDYLHTASLEAQFGQD